MKNRIFLGTCAKLGEAFNVSPIWFRIGFILFSTSVAVIFIYLILGLLID